MAQFTLFGRTYDTPCFAGNYPGWVVASEAMSEVPRCRVTIYYRDSDSMDGRRAAFAAEGRASTYQAAADIARENLDLIRRETKLAHRRLPDPKD